MKLTSLAVVLSGLGVALVWTAPSQAQRPAALSDGRELVAVLELDGVNASKAQLAALTEELRTQLLHSGKFRLVDREQLKTILDEQALQQTGCTSQECAVKVGKILGVRKIVTGRVTRLDDALWQISGQVVDVESAETLRAETLVHKGGLDTLLTTGMASLASKLTGAGDAPTSARPASPDAAASAGTSPARQAATPVSITFDRIVTEPVVRQAATAAAQDFARGFAPEKSYPAATQAAGYSAREAAFVAYPGLGPDYFGKPELRAQVLESVRSWLADSDRLNAAYRQFKPVVLAVLKDQPGAAKLREALAHILPTMESGGPAFSSSEFAAYRKTAAARYQCTSPSPSCTEARQRYPRERRALLTAYGLTEHQLLAYEWIQRRRAEGGDALATAWTAILRDFESSL